MPDDAFEIEVAEILRETPKALLVSTTVDTEHWVPRSQILEHQGGSIMVRHWWARVSKVEQDIANAMQWKPLGVAVAGAVEQIADAVAENAGSERRRSRYDDFLEEKLMPERPVRSTCCR